MVTDQIETFTETGIRLASGEELEADIIVTATGLRMVALGEMEVEVDGEPVDFSRTWTYKGFAYSDVPNLASSFGYINASWTLRADLICEYVCRLLDHMDQTGTDECTPRLRAIDRSMRPRPWIEGFSAGYMQRTMDRLPCQGDHAPWINPQNYQADRKLFRKDPVDDGAMRFTRSSARAKALSGRPGSPLPRILGIFAAGIRSQRCPVSEGSGHSAGVAEVGGLGGPQRGQLGHRGRARSGVLGVDAETSGPVHHPPQQLAHPLGESSSVPARAGWRHLAHQPDRLGLLLDLGGVEQRR